MKKLFSLILAVVLMSCLAACQSEPSIQVIPAESADETTNSKFDFLNIEGVKEESKKIEVTDAVSESIVASDNNSDVVYVTESGTKYHKAGCHHLKKSKIEMSKAAADADGYTPCSVCKP